WSSDDGRIGSETVSRIFMSVLACVLGVCASMQATKPRDGQAAGDKSKPRTGKVAGGKQMRLGNFSVSLTVKDLAASRAFYEKLGFRVVGGNGKKISIRQNDTSTNGLVHGKFPQNIRTFNPGLTRG